MADHKPLLLALTAVEEQAAVEQVEAVVVAKIKVVLVLVWALVAVATILGVEDRLVGSNNPGFQLGGQVNPLPVGGAGQDLPGPSSLNALRPVTHTGGSNPSNAGSSGGAGTKKGPAVSVDPAKVPRAATPPGTGKNKNAA